jgi:tetratricopeptide (TPR) repeat protein
MDTTRGAGRQHLSRNEAAQSGNNYLLAIGINDYAEFPRLSNARRDSEKIVQVLTDFYQFKNSPENVITLFDKDATEDNIDDALEQLSKNILPGDNLIIYYSGHGYIDPETKLGYWIPVDGRKNRTNDYLSNDTILNYIRKIKSLHTIVIVDSCFSGSFFTSNPKSGTFYGYETIPSRYAISSGLVAEVSDGKAGTHSPFAESMIQFLQENKTRSEVPLSELVDHVKAYTANKTQNKQKPFGGYLATGDDNFGMFVFKAKANESDDWEKAITANSIIGFERYLEKYPQGSYRGQAEEKKKVLMEGKIWEDTLRKDSWEAYTNYLQQYPVGKYRSDARKRIEEIDKEMEIEKMAILQTQAEKAERETQRLSFKEVLDKAEASYQRNELKEAQSLYSKALEEHKSGFLPTQTYIIDQIKMCEAGEAFINLIEEGKSAYISGNFELAKQYFEKAEGLQPDHMQARDWVRVVGDKLTQKHDQERDDFMQDQEFVSSISNQTDLHTSEVIEKKETDKDVQKDIRKKPRKNSALIWLIGIGSLIVLGSIGYIISISLSTLSGGQTSKPAPIEVFDEIDPFYGYVTATQLNIRSAPNTENSQVVGTFNQHDEVYITHGRNTGDQLWYYVDQMDISGWVSSNYISLTPPSSYTQPETLQKSTFSRLLGSWTVDDIAIAGMSSKDQGMMDYMSASYQFFQNGSMLVSNSFGARVQYVWTINNSEIQWYNQTMAFRGQIVELTDNRLQVFGYNESNFEVRMEFSR